jgi:predicted MFS family arabinose efflux permease
VAEYVNPHVMRRAVWRHPGLRAILLAEGISALGTQMSLVALPWFVLTTTESATRMGVVLGALVLPAALLGIPAAVVLQRLGVRQTLLVADLCRAPLLAAVPLLDVLDLLTFPVLVAIVLAIGVFGAPYMSAQRLAIPETLADDESLVVQGNALLEGVVRFATLLGPAVAGLAIAAFGASEVLYVDALSYLVAFLILRRKLPRSVPARAGVGPGRSAGAATTTYGGVSTVETEPSASTLDSGGMLAGARFALANPVLRRITAVSLLFGIVFPPLIASLPVVTAERYGEDPRVAGMLYAAMGAGALIGTMVVLPFANRVAPMRLGAVGAVGLSTPLWLLVVGLDAWQFALVMLVSGVFTPILNAPVIAQIMLRAPEQVRAKVLAFVLTSNALAGPVAYALTGPALDRWGLTTV